MHLFVALGEGLLLVEVQEPSDLVVRFEFERGGFVMNGMLRRKFERVRADLEFEAFRTPMGESRRRFTEYTEAILKGLESGVMEHDGELYKQPPARIRPGRGSAGNGYALSTHAIAAAGSADAAATPAGRAGGTPALMAALAALMLLRRSG